MVTQRARVRGANTLLLRRNYMLVIAVDDKLQIRCRPFIRDNNYIVQRKVKSQWRT